MRNDVKNTAEKVGQGRGEQALKFYFTPTDEPGPLDAPNPHAKKTTEIPEDVEALRTQFGERVQEVVRYAGETTIYVERSSIAEICAWLKAQRGYGYLPTLGAIDRFTEEGDRFEVFYNLVSFDPPRRMRLKVRVPEEDPTVPSITGVHEGANWHEREAWDMMGIRFEGHPDMRRMFLPEDFEYHPLRKEFPLLGIPGSLPLPPQIPMGDLTLDPFPAAHGAKPVKSYLEPGIPNKED